MSLLLLIAIIALCWLAYAVLRTQRRMEEELREIRKKCVATTPGTLPSMSTPSVTDMVQATSAKMTDGLQKLLALTI